MRIALIGDVHANLPALEAVISHAKNQQINEIWNLGDFVGYGAYPDEVVMALRRLEAVSILGNYDRKVLKVEEKFDRWVGHKIPQKLLAFKWAHDNLSPVSQAYLRTLPEERLFPVMGFSVLMTHGSPVSRNEHLTPNTPIERLRGLTHTTNASIILCAHSHLAFKRQVDGVWFVNPGSVGRPDDGDPRASYSILTFESGEFKAEHFRIAYDVEKAVAAIHAAHLPVEFAQMAQLGRSLNWILDQN